MALLDHKIAGTAGQPWLVFFNSLGCDWTLWDAQVELLAADYQILLLNKPGHGGAPVVEGANSIPALGQMALDTMDHVGADSAAFCGLSIGARVGTWLAGTAPQRFTKLVLAAGGVGEPDKAAFWDQRIAMVFEQGMQTIADASPQRWFTQAFRDSEPEAVAKIQAMIAACDPRGYAASCEAIRDQDTSAMLGEIACPTLVVAGAHDPAVSLDEQRLISDRINGAHYIEIESSHIINVEARAAFNRALAAFLAR